MFPLYIQNQLLVILYWYHKKQIRFNQKKKKNKLGTGHVGYRTTIACFFWVNQCQSVSYSRLSFHWSVGCTRTQTSIISFMMSRILIPTAFWDNSTHKNASLTWLSCFSTIGGYTIKDFAWVRQFELIVGRWGIWTLHIFIGNTSSQLSYKALKILIRDVTSSHKNASPQPAGHILLHSIKWNWNHY